VIYGTIHGQVLYACADLIVIVDMAGVSSYQPTRRTKENIYIHITRTVIENSISAMEIREVPARLNLKKG
jgi:hypothetical protein